ncbi:MAG: hypothetical protein JJU15_20375 [Pararhodobacter sp.]|nr:hypothetical protein [Pararhodobacter sp.]
MYPIAYQGVDTLDVAIMGAASDEVLATLETYQGYAKDDKYNKFGVPLLLGSEHRQFIIKAHGKIGGYRYTLVDTKTGSIFSVKNERQQDLWNFFVSTRAHSLLSRGYEAMKQEIDACLAAMGAAPKAYSVNRIDYAFDVIAPDFVLDMAHFVAPKNAKVSPYYVAGHHLSDHGDKLPIGSVMRGGRFESVTIAKMPGRQVIVYDKTSAAKVQQTPYWFEAWGVDPTDPSKRVYRVEVRAGKDAWGSLIGPSERRDYQTIEARHQPFVSLALDQIRYVTDRAEVSNVTRAQLHPLWDDVRSAVELMSERPEPPLTPAYVMELMRKQRVAMAMAQGFGNLNNLFILQGHSPAYIAANYARLASEHARGYVKEIGADWHAKKLDRIAERQGVFLGGHE